MANDHNQPFEDDAFDENGDPRQDAQTPEGTADEANEIHLEEPTGADGGSPGSGSWRTSSPDCTPPAIRMTPTTTHTQGSMRPSEVWGP